MQTSGSTTVSKSVSATVTDIAPNDTVVVTGPVNADGSYAATTIVVSALGNGGLGGAFVGNRTRHESPGPSATGFGGGPPRTGTAGQ